MEEYTKPANYYLRVEYGTTSATFLATRCLQQLIDDEAVHYPEAAKLAKGFYVDDLITGADEVETAHSMQQNLIDMLSKGGFTLRKWSSNHPALLEHLAAEDVERNVLVCGISQLSALEP